MLKKKYGYFYLSIVLLLQCLMLQAVYATPTAVPAVTKSAVNVALFKPVAASSWNPSLSYPKSNINDDDGNTLWVGYNANTNCTDIASGNFTYNSDLQWIQIDLLKRYKVEKVQIFDRLSGTSDDNRRHFQILGSNDSSFSDPANYTVLGGIDNLDNTIFPQNGVYTLDLSATKAPYRYIRYQKTNEKYACPAFAELKVFATLTATEVSRNADAYASDYYNNDISNYGPKKAVDGSNAWGLAWLAKTDNTIYHFWRCDLASAYNIGLIDIEGRSNNCDEVPHRYMFRVYGSNDNATDDTLKTNVYAPSPMYTQLSYLENPNNMNPINGYVIYPAITSSYARPYYEVAVDDRTAYRYLTVKKTYKCNACIGEFRAYVINPMINSVTRSGNNFKVDFSDTMDTSTLSSSNITVTKDGSAVAYTGTLSSDCYTYSLNIPGMVNGGIYKINVQNSVKNNLGINMANSYSCSITPTANNLTLVNYKLLNSKDGTGSEISSLTKNAPAGAVVNVQNNNTASKNITLIVALFKNGMLYTTSTTSGSVSANGQITLKTGVDVPNDSGIYQAKVFLWDDFISNYPVSHNILSANTGLT